MPDLPNTAPTPRGMVAVRARHRVADPTCLALAAQQNIPLRPLIGDAYRDMMPADQAGLRTLWAIRPWRE